ncbi:mitochondrial 54S ribosomal protein mL44 [Apiospora kogelbergensis]|uniref:mitochondrial 54S ribosomal protein mL44 n=1 Tax=Apiospora kogelbergensis TaxID=1337665 RepID=UPI00313284AD
MKRLRLDRLASQLLAAQTSPAARLLRPSTISRSIPQTCRHSSLDYNSQPCQRRHQSTAASPAPVEEEDHVAEVEDGEPTPEDLRNGPLPSPHPSRAASSAKLAALHARLSLSSKIPLETLARALVDPSADAHPKYNNANLAYVGSTVIHYHTSETLITRYPRLPMTILFAAMKGYAANAALHQVARAWGVESAAAPGEEVDPGLLQYDPLKPTVVMNKWGYVRANTFESAKYQSGKGLSGRVVYGSNPFGESGPAKSLPDFEVENDRNTKALYLQDAAPNAYANFVRAVVGAVYMHCGRDAAKNFVRSHFLTRTLDLSKLFEFKLPTRELARLCAREDFEAPVARLESETGRASRTPVFVVGIYSGNDKLGEAPGPDLDSALVAASINALKSWYLYSPGQVGVPSDTFTEDAAAWKPAYVDIGEIIS